MITIPQTPETVQVVRQPAPKGTPTRRVRVRHYGQYSKCDTYWNRPMTKEEKTFLTQRDKWGSLRSNKSLTDEQRHFAGVQFQLWHEAFCQASEAADAVWETNQAEVGRAA